MSEDKRRPFKGKKRGLEEEISMESSNSESEHEAGETDGRRRKKLKKGDVVVKKRKSEKKTSPDECTSPRNDDEAHEDDRKLDIRSYSPFQLYCDFILKRFIQKDSDGFFSKPVKAADAPEYYNVILTPMDYSTIENKINSNEYSNIADLRNDFHLVATNAMTYNNPNTIYYLAAVKLQTLIRYFFSPNYLEYLKYSVPFGTLVSHEKLGLMPRAATKSTIKKSERTMSVRDAVIDSETTKELMKGASSGLKGKLSDKKPPWPMGYLDRQENGSAVLNIVSGSDKARISMGDFVGKLEKGVSSVLSEYSPLELSSNCIHYSNYGPFSSFAPQFDSTWSNLHKKDSDLLLSCYGDKNNVVDAISLRQIALSTSENMVKVVDGILDTLTDGEHSRTLRSLEVSAKTVEYDDSKPQIESIMENVDSLRNLGLDVSYINELRKELGLVEPDNQSCEQLLNVAGQMLQDLSQLQTHRLNQYPSISLMDINTPGQTENELAMKVGQQFTEVVRHGATPRDIATIPQIHQAIGVNNGDDFDYDVLSEFITLPT